MTVIGMLNRSARRIAVVGAFVALATVAGCDSSEDRAQKHFESAIALLEQGDTDRAILEFRNVFKLNANHHEARLAYAKMLRDRGSLGEAFREYRKAAEQTPEDVDILVAVAELSLENANWDEFKRQTDRLMTLASDRPLVQSMDATLKYNEALKANDEGARSAQIIRARELLNQDPKLLYADRLIVDDLLRSQDWSAALKKVNASLQNWPDDLGLLQIKLGLLNQLGEKAEALALLEDIVKRFPENERMRESLIAVYVNEKDIDGADALLKADAEASNKVEPSRRYAAFLLKFRGADAAIAELERIIAEGRLEKVVFQTYLARLRFDNGDEDAAIAMLEDISAKSERTSDIRNLETELAQMLFRKGNSVGARQLIEKVLEEDPTHPGAAKLKSAWLIEDDNTDDAVLLLRNALSNAPRDAALMTLLAAAYERQGNHDLAVDLLAQAVEASDKAPTESLRYAAALSERQQYSAAEQVLIDALRVSRDNVDILTSLGQVYVALANWPQAEGVLRRLKELDTEQSRTAGAGLEARILTGQKRTDELQSLLENLSGDNNVGAAARTALLRNKIETDGAAAGLEYVESQLAETPDDPDLRFARAGLLVILDRQAEADPIYRKLIEDFPLSDRVWMTLYRIERLKGDRAAANKILDDALASLPEAPTLLLSKAEELQADGEWEKAIEIYSGLYERNSGAQIVANNLASLLADHRTDEESLKQAYNVARRMKDTTVPAFQDTYGWIAHRLGNIAEALPYLEGAAKGLETDPTVQYHYAVSLAANGKNAEALEQFKKTEAMLDVAKPPAYADEVKSEIARLSALPKQ